MPHSEQESTYIMSSKTVTTGSRPATGAPALEVKRRSSHYSEKHPSSSRVIVINGESMEHFHEIRAVYFARFQPAGELEEYLVEELVACRWHMNRMASREAASLDQRMDCQQQEIADSFESIDPSTRAAIAFQSLTGKSSALATCRRFESALARQFDSTARHLEDCQAKRKTLQNEPKAA
jgi:hypothetical protein